MTLTLLITALAVAAVYFACAAPSATVRQTPAGRWLKDGYQVLTTVALDPDISFWEKTITPPGLDNGDAIEQTTQHNADWRGFAPRGLITMTESTRTVAYDPAVYTQIAAVIGRETTITERFADGSTLAYYGYVKSFQPNEMSEGNQPEATVVIQPTNWDYTNNVEAAPVLTSVSGT